MKWILILPVRFYQLLISPDLPGSCRHQPTCSQYMIDALIDGGLLKGVYLGLIRIAKCNLLGTCG